MVKVAAVAAERVTWPWEQRLPAGKAVVLDGDPGLGKSTITLDWAARITTGTPWPDGGVPMAGDVVLATAEDGIADTIRPRLEAAGADVDRVHVLTGVGDEEGQAEPLTLPGHVPAIRAAVEAVGAVLVIIDPLMAFLAGQVNANRDQDVRRALRPLTDMAGATGTTIVVVRHLNKSPGGSPLYRGGGSIGIVGAVRLGMIVAADPDDDNRRILAVTKSNLAREPPALAYRMVDDPEHGCGRIAWGGETGHTASDLLAIPEAADAKADRSDAKKWLGDLLGDGAVLADDAYAAWRKAGGSDSTLKRARQDLGAPLPQGRVRRRRQDPDLLDWGVNRGSELDFCVVG